MKRFEIHEDTNNDRYLIFIYNENRIVGFNYHHGLGDLDSDYFETDDELYETYMRMIDWQDVPPSVEVAAEAIDQHRRMYNECEREMFVQDAVEKYFETMANDIMRSLFIDEDLIKRCQREVIDFAIVDVVRAWQQIAVGQTKFKK